VARQNLFRRVVPAFAVGKIRGVKNLIFTEKIDFLNQHFVVGFAGKKDSS
jgi:hypothetical protein